MDIYEVIYFAKYNFLRFDLRPGVSSESNSHYNPNLSALIFVHQKMAKWQDSNNNITQQFGVRAVWVHNLII